MKNFLKDNWFKISLIIVILIAVIVVGLVFYKIQTDKQNSIKEQANKEYVAAQKKSCMDIYETEGKKYNNVREWHYNSLTDTCVITYNLPDNQKKTKTQCEAEYKSCSGTTGFNYYCFEDEMNCIDGIFTKNF